MASKVTAQVCKCKWVHVALLVAISSFARLVIIVGMNVIRAIHLNF